MTISREGRSVDRSFLLCNAGTCGRFHGNEYSSIRGPGAVQSHCLSLLENVYFLNGIRDDRFDLLSGGWKAVNHPKRLITGPDRTGADKPDLNRFMGSSVRVLHLAG